MVRRRRRLDHEVSLPPETVRPPRRGPGLERAFAAQVLGALAQTLGDRIGSAAALSAGHGAHAPAALTTLLWYPDRPIAFLAARLRISHPGAVQLSQRLAQAGLVERWQGEDARVMLLNLTPDGQRTALDVLADRRAVLDRAVAALPDAQLRPLSDAVCAMLVALTDDMLTSEHMCRLCDELACPDTRCPVEGAEPAPAHRRGAGYGVDEAEVAEAADLENDVEGSEA